MSLLEIRNYYLALAYFENFRADGDEEMEPSLARGQGNSGLAEPPAASSTAPGLEKEEGWTS